jgi:hypothetical protein
MRVLAAESFNQWLASGEFVPTIIQVLADPQAPEASGLAGEVLQELIALSGRHVTKGIDTPLIFQQFAAEKSLAVLVPCILELKVTTQCHDTAHSTQHTAHATHVNRTRTV